MVSKIFLMFSLWNTLGDDPIWGASFTHGLLQPPTIVAVPPLVHVLPWPSTGTSRIVELGSQDRELVVWSGGATSKYGMVGKHRDFGVMILEVKRALIILMDMNWLFNKFCSYLWEWSNLSYILIFPDAQSIRYIYLQCIPKITPVL